VVAGAPHLKPQAMNTRRRLLHALAGPLQEHLLLDEHRAWREPKPRPSLGGNEPIRVGVIGYGHMGGGHTDGLLRARDEKTANLDVVAVADVCRPRREAAAALLRTRQPGVDVRAYLDYEELLARPDVHAVLIATPEHWHAQHAVHAVEAGKDIYVEKPMTLTLEESVWLHRVVERSSSIAQVGTQYLMHPKFEHARRIVRRGDLGALVSSQVLFGRNSREGEWTYEIDPALAPGPDLDWERWCGPAGHVEWDTELFHRWRRYRRWSTGIVGDLLSHLIAPFAYALDQGPPRRLVAHGSHMVDFAMENHDQVVAHVEFESGHVLTLVGSTCNERGGQWVIRGNRADLLLGANRARIEPQAAWAEDDETLERQQFPETSDDIQQDLRIDWLRCVRSRKPNRSPVSLGLQHMVVVEMFARSLWSGRAQRFDPYTFRVSDE
jgi:predicted dehydrogenase